MVLNLPVYWHLPKSSLSLWFFTLHSSISEPSPQPAVLHCLGRSILWLSQAMISYLLIRWLPLLTYCVICTTDKTHLLLLRHQLYLLSKSYFLSSAQVVRLQALQLYSEALSSKQLHGCFLYLKETKKERKHLFRLLPDFSTLL